jgi:hypothetical protein
MNEGYSALRDRNKNKSTAKANVGGNSGAVISPAPGLGLSAYQNPKQANQRRSDKTYQVQHGESTR